MQVLFVRSGSEHRGHDFIVKSRLVDTYSVGYKYGYPLSNFISLLTSLFSLPRYYDVYIAESGNVFILLALLKLLNLLDGKLVPLFASPFFYNLSRSIFLRKLFLPLIYQVDAIILVSHQQINYIRKLFSFDIPYIVLHPCVSNLCSFVKEYSGFKSKSPIFLTIATFNYKLKGVDIFENIVKMFRGKGFVFGLGRKNSSNCVNYMGFKSFDMICDYFSKSDFYVHPARYDSFPLSVIEAMYAGMIPIVSDTVGLSYYLYNISPILVFKSGDTFDLASSVDKLLGLSKRELYDLSKECRLLAKKIISSSKNNSARLEKFLCSL